MHAIAAQLQTVQRPQFYQLYAQIGSRGRYCHSGCADINVFTDGQVYAAAEPADGIAEALRDFMNWIYKRLEDEWNYLNSDETVSDNIAANEYDFTIEGTAA